MLPTWAAGSRFIGLAASKALTEVYVDSPLAGGGFRRGSRNQLHAWELLAAAVEIASVRFLSYRPLRASSILMSGARLRWS